MTHRTFLVSLLLLSAPSAISAEAPHLNLAPPSNVDLGASAGGGNGLLNATTPPMRAPNPAPSPVHLVVSCVDESGVVIPPGDTRYDRCVSEAHGRGHAPIGSTGSTQAIGVSIGQGG